MNTCLRHRGPDAKGHWVDDDAGIMFAHRRLSILDLSEAGHQPMASHTGRYVIVYNGELYNFRALKAALAEAGAQTPKFRGDSDTEVLLAAVERWGLPEALRRCIGMFAMALWDRQDRCLQLVRDRVGVKPLYYGRVGSDLVFGSELKAIEQHPAFSRQIDRNAVAMFLRYSFIPAPHTIYSNIRKLEPGTILTFRRPDRDPDAFRYWSALSAAEEGMQKVESRSDREHIDRLEELIRDSVRLRMVSDVPLGAFLSGGVDSSTVVALMQAQSSSPVQTFTIGSGDGELDETRHARAVAAHLGTRHTELIVSAQEALNVIPSLPGIYDEPFADPSQIATFLVSRLARQSVTVSLSGDGGDELFGGYNRHVWGERAWRRLSAMPQPARRITGRFLTMLSPDSWDTVYHMFESALPNRLRLSSPGFKVHKLAQVITASDTVAFYDALSAQWQDPWLAMQGVRGTLPAQLTTPAGADIRQQMMFFDLMRYLPDDILVKLDRASMAVGLEAREPLLDHRLVQFAWALPTDVRIRNGVGKWVLRQVLARYVPPALTDRPKTGFSLPIHEWLRGPLRGWAEDLLSESRLRSGGVFNAQVVRRVWSAHLSGRRRHEFLLWCVLMFQAWDMRAATNE